MKQAKDEGKDRYGGGYEYQGSDTTARRSRPYDDDESVEYGGEDNRVEDDVCDSHLNISQR